ncbi:MAG TPA: site-2 protease family protein [Spirochaetia bacterium]|nr:site-2 protease family protein [Spirochaetia bacterium]
MLNLNLKDIVFLIPCIIAGFTVHEASHAFLALHFGDTTPCEQGRCTWNPLAHIDLIGMVLIIFAGFGWARPVPINPGNFRNPKRDGIAVAMAGPTANAILALVFVALAKIVSLTGAFTVKPVGPNLYQFFGEMVWVNLLLAVFNLLPIPPLDGSTLILSAIPDRYAAQKAIFVKYGALLLLVVILAGSVTSVNIFPIGRVIQWLSIQLYGIFGM